MSDERALASCHSPFLQALPRAAQEHLLQRAKRRDYDPGQPLFFKGDEAPWLFLIETGLVEISLMSAQGKKAVINHQGSGELVGELAALDAGPRSADATALQPTTGLRIQKTDLVTTLGGDSQACLEVIALLCERVRNASALFESRAIAPAPARLARCLLTLADKWGEPGADGGWHLLQRFSQTELGEFSGLARENVNRLLRDWQAAGWVRFQRGELSVLDPAALEDLLDG